MIKKLLHTRYRVTDLERTVAFYRDVLGLEETRRHTSGRGSQLVFFKAPESEEEIEICKYDKSGPVVVGPDLTHLAFEVDDLEKFARQAAAKGYPLSDGPHPNGNGGAIAFIDAPEGAYEIELIQRGRETGNFSNALVCGGIDAKNYSQSMKQVKRWITLTACALLFVGNVSAAISSEDDDEVT